MEVAKAASTTVDDAEVADGADVVADGENDSATETNVMRMDNDFIIGDVVRSFPTRDAASPSSTYVLLRCKYVKSI
jgi:predicted secreted protein